MKEWKGNCQGEKTEQEMALIKQLSSSSSARPSINQHTHTHKHKHTDLTHTSVGRQCISHADGRSQRPPEIHNSAERGVPFCPASSVHSLVQSILLVSDPLTRPEQRVLWDLFLVPYPPLHKTMVSVYVHTSITM